MLQIYVVPGIIRLGRSLLESRLLNSLTSTLWDYLILATDLEAKELDELLDFSVDVVVILGIFTDPLGRRVLVNWCSLTRDKLLENFKFVR